MYNQIEFLPNLIGDLMTNAPEDDLLQRGIAAARAGQADEARRLLAQAIQQNPRSETAWLWMSSVVQTDDQRIHCLRQVIALNPNNDFALKGLRALGALPPEQPAAPVHPTYTPTEEQQPAYQEDVQSAQEAYVSADEQQIEYGYGSEEESEAVVGTYGNAPVTSARTAYEDEIEPVVEVQDTAPITEEPAPAQAAASEPVPPPPASVRVPRPRRQKIALPTPPAPDGVPLISQDVIAYAQREAAEILRAVDEERRLGKLDVVWYTPETAGTVRRRAVIDPLYLAIGGSILIVILTVILVSSIAGIIRRGQQGASAERPTATPILTATQTVTPLPTRTPTAAGQVFNPGPTIPAGDAPRGDIRFGITPTSPYIATPHPSIPRLLQAQQAFDLGQYDNAITLSNEVIDAGGNIPVDAYYFVAQSLAYQGKFDDATTVAQQGLQRDQAFAPLHGTLAYINLRQGNPRTAQREAEEAIQRDPKFVQGYLILAEVYLSQNDMQSALNTVQAGKDATSPYDVNFLVMEARIDLALDKPEDATAIANLAHYIDPGSEPVNVLLGRGRIELGLMDSAIVGLEDYLFTINPSSADAWALLARAYDAVGREKDSQEAYARAIDLNDQSLEALLGRADFFMERGHYDQAYGDFDRAVSIDQNNFDAHYGRALSAMKLDQYEEALPDLEFVRGVTPNVPEVDANYVVALARTGSYDQVIDTANTVLSLPLTTQQQAAVLEARGEAYFNQGDMTGAQNDLTASLAKQDTGSAHYYLGLVYEATDQKRLAIHELEWVVFWNKFFSYPFADSAQSHLDSLYEARQAEIELSYTPTHTATPTATATRTPRPTFTPIPTRTPRPTFTPVPSPTPIPTKTPVPSNTPPATKTPTPTASPTP